MFRQEKTHKRHLNHKVLKAKNISILNVHILYYKTYSCSACVNTSVCFWCLETVSCAENAAACTTANTLSVSYVSYGLHTKLRVIDKNLKLKLCVLLQKIVFFYIYAKYNVCFCYSREKKQRNINIIYAAKCIYIQM